MPGGIHQPERFGGKISHWNMSSKQFSTNTSAENVGHCCFKTGSKEQRERGGTLLYSFVQVSSFVFKLLEVKLKKIWSQDYGRVPGISLAILWLRFNHRNWKHRLQMLLLGGVLAKNQQSWQFENRECFLVKLFYKWSGCLFGLCLAYRYKRIYTRPMYDL